MCCYLRAHVWLHVPQPTQVLICLRHKHMHAAFDLAHGGLIKLPQTPGVALLGVHLRGMGKVLNLGGDSGTAQDFPVSGNKHRAVLCADPAGIVQKLIPQAGGDLNQAPGSIGCNGKPAVPHRLCGQLLQFLHRQTQGRKYLRQQIGPFSSERPGGGEQPEIFIPGERRLRITADGQLSGQLVLPESQPRQEAVCHGDRRVDGARGVALSSQGGPPLPQRIPPDPLFSGQKVIEGREVVPVLLDGVRAAPAKLHAPYKFTD